MIQLEQHRFDQDATVLKGRANRRTRGRLTIDGKPLICVLEDEVRIDDPSTPQNEGAKIKGRTAIPAGRYQIKLTSSPKFGRIMPEIVCVPNYTGIRVHSGHDETHTEGCLLTAGGFDPEGDIIGGSSRPAQAKFEAAIVPRLQAGEECWIDITNDFLG